jgi:hypothetical protein
MLRQIDVNNSFEPIDFAAQVCARTLRHCRYVSRETDIWTVILFGQLSKF